MSKKFGTVAFLALLSGLIVAGCSSKQEVTQDDTAASPAVVSSNEAAVSSSPTVEGNSVPQSSLGASSSGRGQ